jgi:4-hydroxybenzoate polyprenyltransferase
MPEKAALVPSRPRLTRKNLIHWLHQCWLIGRWLSLDVVAGAAISCLMVCRLMEVGPFPWVAIGVLAGTVFLIYTLDHLLDIHRATGSILPPRRAFHYRFRKLLTGLCLFLSCFLAATTLWVLPFRVICFGLFLAILVIVYLWLVWKLGSQRGKKWFHKELVIALLYTAGTWGVALCYSQEAGLADIYLAAAFALVALQNLLVFSCYEQEEDMQQGQRSMALYLGSRQLSRLLLMVFVLSGLVFLLCWTKMNNQIEKQVWLTEVIMSVTLLLIFAFPRYFSRHKRYRWVGDGIFLLPVWLL